MKSTTQSISLILAGMIGGMAVHPVIAQTVTLDVPKSSFDLGEPVYVTVTVANTSSEAAQVPARLSPETGGVAIRVTGPGGETSGFVPLALLDHDQPRHELAPGGQVAEDFSVFYGARGWTFDRQGSYELSATVVISSSGVTSEPLSIEVRPASALSSQLVAEGQASEEAGKFLTWLGGDHLSAGIELLGSVGSAESGSSLANHIELALGWSKSRAFTNYATGEVRAPDNQAALAHLGKVREEDLPPRLRVLKGLAEAACLIRVGETERAREVLDRLARVVGEVPALAGMTEQIVRLQQASKSPRESE